MTVGEEVEEPLFEEQYGMRAPEDKAETSEREAIQATINTKEWELEVEKAAPRLRNPSNVSPSPPPPPLSFHPLLLSFPLSSRLIVSSIDTSVYYIGCL
jgi:hypothetical protein